MVALSPEHRAAVEHPGGPLLIVGGAGTGKTTVLAERFLHLTRHGAPPESLMYGLTMAQCGFWPFGFTVLVGGVFAILGALTVKRAAA